MEFLGFTVTSDSVRPSDKFLRAIKDFPRPRDITGSRSWLGLVNQVNVALSQSDTMLPFRNLLKPSSDFLWTQDLQERSKEWIIEAVEHGVSTFDMGKVTCLATDWSKQGIGFTLLQKECICTTITPVCCSTGWSLVFAAHGSPAGQRAGTHRSRGRPWGWLEP